MSQALRRAGKPVAERFESQLLEEPARRTDMVGILGADQKVAVYPATLDGPEAQTQLDVWEDQVDLGEATLIGFRSPHTLIGVEEIVVRDAESADGGRRGFD